ncbi:MAG: bifunctional diaminohydroxyphosphoribosylaminopyrimidine deaminase/5-amino-6-(5-phosphoribosylamino)uracil reductase RibD, partial [Gammaproteobacteria bacterium]|nr:bifunctional diaminohydroxyphosphoribosylaminopyrimidine deaminase/5-amino-6-(5-phosphoribosylamino)uracil reductase RibD [Gammaproteobacteria bacterium]
MTEMVDANDFRYMAQAIRLAERGMYTTDPNPRVGCVLVKNNEVVGEGWHERAGEPHAEIMALNQAGEKAKDSDAYVSLEPCCHHGKTPPCSDALIKAGVSRVVVAMEDPNPQVAGKGISQLRSAGIEVDVGILTAQAESLNPGFIRRMQQGRPFVRCKMAMSLDGRTAMASGESQWITGEAARQDAHRLRARSSAIITGIGTVSSDNPSMNARLENEKVIQPLRIVLDSQLSINNDAKMIALPGRTVVCTICRDEDKIKTIQSSGIEVVLLEEENGKVSLSSLMDYLNDQQVNEVLLEAG